jgi:hypothetical protein
VSPIADKRAKDHQRQDIVLDALQAHPLQQQHADDLSDLL